MEHNLPRQFIKYVTFNILGQMGYAFYTMTDTFFVSTNLGADGLTALNLAFPMFCLISGLGLMVGIGASTRFSILKSQQKKQEANHIFTHAMVLSTFLGTVMFILGLFASKPLTTLLGADAEVFDITHRYLNIILCLAPAFIFNHTLQCFIRNDGSPLLSMTAMVIGSLSNIVLDYLFIFPCKMGIAGAALATGLSPLISLVVLSTHWLTKKNTFHFTLPQWKSLPSHGHLIVSNGLSPFLTELASGIVMFLFNAILLKLSGNIGVAAFSVITVISLVVIALYSGLSQGCQPLISQAYGKKRPSDVSTLYHYALKTSLLLSTLIYLTIYFQAPTLVSIFNSDHNPQLATLAIHGLKLYFLACPWIGLNIVRAIYFISLNQPRPAQFISALRSFILLVPMAFLMSSLFGISGLWLSYPLTECLVFLLSINKRCHLIS